MNIHDKKQPEDSMNTHDKKQPEDSSTKDNEKKEFKPDTIGLMFDTLNALGCQPIKNDNGSIHVSYQGENFHIVFKGMYVRIWDATWAKIKADDPDLPKVREAVNAANYKFGPTVVLANPNDEGFILFHSFRDIMLHPACPDNVPFVKAVLDSFFEIKEQVYSDFHKINVKQMKRQKKHRPVGFTTTHKEK